MPLYALDDWRPELPPELRPGRRTGGAAALPEFGLEVQLTGLQERHRAERERNGDRGKTDGRGDGNVDVRRREEVDRATQENEEA